MMLKLSATKCWYGFFYFNNASQYALKTEIEPNFTGATICWPQPQGAEDGKISVVVEPFDDSILLIRCFDFKTSVSYKQFTKQREYSPDELIEMAK